MRGEVRVWLETDYPKRIARKGEIVLRSPDGATESRKITSVKLDESGGNWAIIKFEGIDDRDSAAKLRGYELRIFRWQCAKLPKGHYYFHELVGLSVEATDGRELGAITEVQQHPGNDIYITDKGIIIPALKSIVKEIDIRGGKMVIIPVPGLIEED